MRQSVRTIALRYRRLKNHDHDFFSNFETDFLLKRLYVRLTDREILKSFRFHQFGGILVPSVEDDLIFQKVLNF